MKIAMVGVNGKMGQSMLKGIYSAEDISVVGAVDINGAGKDLGEVLGTSPIGIVVENDLEDMIKTKEPDIIVDFTSPLSVKENVLTALALKKHVVVGTTGLSDADLKDIDRQAQAVSRVAFVAPNFALGAVLMMNFAAQAARYFPNVEVIELHHDQKKDAPSGTAVKTLAMMAREREKIQQASGCTIEKIPGSRGGEYDGMRVHSVRLPGYVAHQEVIFGGRGQTLTIRHDSMNRDSFVDGLLLAIRSIADQTPGLIFGLEKVL